jgi:hypothetical protein
MRSRRYPCALGGIRFGDGPRQSQKPAASYLPFLRATLWDLPSQYPRWTDASKTTHSLTDTLGLLSSLTVRASNRSRGLV